MLKQLHKDITESHSNFGLIVFCAEPNYSTPPKKKAGFDQRQIGNGRISPSPNSLLDSTVCWSN